MVHNRAAFESRYGTGHRIAGEFTGSLNNAGDDLALFGPVGEPILDFHYDGSWFASADGLGYSLVARDPSAPLNAWNSIEGWRISSAQGGSPGLTDPPPLNIPVVLINEVLASTPGLAGDRIELFNPNDQPVDIGGWFLTDAFYTPRKFRVPEPTSIPAHGFRVFTEADFNPAPGAATSFALDAQGDDAWLFSADASSNLTGYVHGFHFGASEGNVTLGRHVTSEGREHFVAQVAASLGATNLGPRVGPVVINELMFHPPDTGTLDNTLDEFIELVSLTNAPVPLFCELAPTNTWQLKGGVDFVFPQDLTLLPGEHLLVLNFDPADTVQLAAFRARYTLPGGVRLFGPYGAN